MKSKWHMVLDNAGWVVNRGDCVNFWLDTWCLDSSLADALNIPEQHRCALRSLVSYFVMNQHWNVPESLLHHLPQLCATLSSIPASLLDNQAPNQPIWRS